MLNRNYPCDIKLFITRSKCESESDSVVELTYCCYNRADLGALVELAEFPQREGRIEMRRGSK